MSLIGLGKFCAAWFSSAQPGLGLRALVPACAAGFSSEGLWFRPVRLWFPVAQRGFRLHGSGFGLRGGVSARAALVFLRDALVAVRGGGWWGRDRCPPGRPSRRSLHLRGAPRRGLEAWQQPRGEAARRGSPFRGPEGNRAEGVLRVMASQGFACLRSCSRRERGFSALACGSAGFSGAGLVSVFASGDGASMRRVLFIAV